MNEKPTHTDSLAADSPASGASPDGQVPGKITFMSVAKSPESIPPYRVDYIDRGNGLEVVREYFSVPSEPIPADDEQVEGAA